jgi:GNAT superfamily N-acetyltransferase
VQILQTKQIPDLFLNAAYHIWQAEYPGIIKYNNISSFSDFLSNLQETEYYLAINKVGHLSGLAYVFTRDAEKWFAIMLYSSYQSKGIGTKLLNCIKHNYSAINGWVVAQNDLKKNNGELYKSPLLFYIKNNFTILENQTTIKNGMHLHKINWTKIE